MHVQKSGVCQAVVSVVEGLREVVLVTLGDWNMRIRDGFKCHLLITHFTQPDLLTG